MNPSTSSPDLCSELARHPLFAELSAHELAELGRHAVRREYAAGSYLTREGEPARGFYALVQGKVAVQLDVPVRGPVTLQTLADGEVLGWSWLAPPSQWAFSARAQQPTTVLELDGVAVLKLCETEPRLGYRLMLRLAHMMAQRLHATRIQLLDIYGTPRK